MADLGFPVRGGRRPRGGRGLPRRVHFKNFVCRNERIWTRRGACAPVDPPMVQIGEGQIVRAALQ